MTNKPKKTLNIRPSCASCGLSGEASLPFENPATGKTEFACNYIIDPYVAEQVATIEKHLDLSKLRNANGQIKFAGNSSYFCSIFCTMQGLFCYGRCAGCSKALPRKKLLRDWHLVHNGEGKSQYAKFEYCSPECKNKFGNREAIWSARHVLETLKALGAEVKMPDEFVSASDADFKGRCANQTCGKGKDARGNRVRARVPARGDFCSSACQRAHAEVSSRIKVAISPSGDVGNIAASL